MQILFVYYWYQKLSIVQLIIRSHISALHCTCHYFLTCLALIKITITYSSQETRPSARTTTCQPRQRQQVNHQDAIQPSLSPLDLVHVTSSPLRQGPPAPKQSYITRNSPMKSSSSEMRNLLWPSGLTTGIWSHLSCTNPTLRWVRFPRVVYGWHGNTHNYPGCKSDSVEEWIWDE